MSIVNIGQKDIQRITSGQVITDLVSVVKELVENSIDAGSTKVDITFSNYGLDAIEVTDDGGGIEKEDFPFVCLKHCTSKLTSFQQLSEEGLLTLGFRGEAMSSLCSIAGNVVITTCTKDNFPRASQLDYDNMGRLSHEKKVVGGLKGTNVKVLKIFKNLPVRQKNLIKNLKREFNKAVNYLMNYLIIFNNIRFTIFNVNSSGKKTLLMGTKGGMKTSTLDNLVSIYGTNGSYGLIPIDFQVSDYHNKPIVRLGKEVGSMDLKFTGYVSNCSFGLGRSSADRQFIYLNKRPIIMKKFLKSINEIYKSFNHVQFPVVILNIDINTSFVDVNVTPDKRVVMIQNEDLINEILREELQKFYEQQNNVIPKNRNSEISLDGESVTILKNKTRMQTIKQEPVVKKERATENKIDQKDEEEEEEREASNEEEEAPEKKEETPEKEEEVPEEKEETPGEEEEAVEVGDEKIKENVREVDFEQVDEDKEESGEEDLQFPDSIVQNITVENLTQHHDPHSQHNKSLKNSKDSFPTEHDKCRSHQVCSCEETLLEEFSRSVMQDTDSQPTTVLTYNNSENQLSAPQESLPCLSATSVPSQPAPSNDKLTISIGDHVEERPVKRPKVMRRRSDIIFGDDELVTNRHEFSDVYKYKQNLDVDPGKWDHLPSVHNTEDKGVKDIKVDDIADSEAEPKLSYIINKSDFANMKVVGQFNLGFILVTMNDCNNLFIIDQHASDEKYNYEKYLQTINFEKNNQKLIAPNPVELSIIDEMVCFENRDIFKHNGFLIEYDENAEKHRIKLAALPQLKHTQFDMSDFHELIHLINERGGGGAGNIRCSKWEKLLASRACRTSIMIGQPLTKARMQSVVKNLSSLDKPWNCPHGRPTMRHLIELQQIPRFDLDYQI